MASNRGKRPVLKADKRYPSTRRGRGGSGSGSGTGRPGGKAAAKAPPKPRRRARKAAPRRRRGLIGWVAAAIGAVIRASVGLIWRVALVAAVLVGGGVLYFYNQLPPAGELIDVRTRGSVTLHDRHGDVFAWRGEQFDRIASVDQVSRHLKNAVIATEDRRFYWHPGIDPQGIASAIRINLSEGRGPLSGHGGSTLTQQAAKLMCLGVPYDPDLWLSEADYEADCRRTTLGRKGREALYSLAMEAKYTKDEILTIYLNRAYLGASARGFEAAAQRYFGIPASRLSPAQSAMLAGLLVAPSRFAPTNDLERSQRRAATVLRLMHEQGYLTEAEYTAARADPATLADNAEQTAGGNFADWVMDTGPSFLTRDTTEDVLLRTTFDPQIQAAAEEAVRLIFQEKVRDGSEAQAAIVVMSADGAVRAMVGGRDTTVSGGFNRAAQARRQTGSSFKPFIYAAAMDLGYSPNDTVVDEPYCIDVPGSGQYCPKNYSRDFAGRVTLTEALARSLNIPAVKISEFVGRDIVQKVAEDFGIESSLADGPALALGVSDSTLVEMTGAFAGFLNGGRAVLPYGLEELRLRAESEPLMGRGGGYGKRVISEEAAGKLVYMLSRVVEEGTGTRARLGDRQAAGKTGTTQAARDAWFVGFTADYVMGVWMGYDDNTALSGVTGGTLPAEIWREAMLRIHQDDEIRPLPMQEPEPPRAVVEAQPSPQTSQSGVRQPAPQPVPQPQPQERRGLIGVLEGMFGN
ncbi:MAG: Membrane carboxypeptidase (penicillin-binding protein) [Rhodobacteraceae bacterium HLUCCA09]|nr:MAG: Membrane carboxypeptidase (penicillin-binding protein) [Rhodobacteraceae bacterium HLUCCA09]